MGPPAYLDTELGEATCRLCGGAEGDMNREAKIGLAAVLVTGVAVTLVVGRTLYCHAKSQSSAELAADGDADLRAMVESLPEAPVAPNRNAPATSPLPWRLVDQVQCWNRER